MFASSSKGRRGRPLGQSDKTIHVLFKFFCSFRFLLCIEIFQSVWAHCGSLLQFIQALEHPTFLTAEQFGVFLQQLRHPQAPSSSVVADDAPVWACIKRHLLGDRFVVFTRILVGRVSFFSSVYVCVHVFIFKYFLKTLFHFLFRQKVEQCSKRPGLKHMSSVERRSTVCSELGFSECDEEWWRCTDVLLRMQQLLPCLPFMGSQLFLSCVVQFLFLVPIRVFYTNNISDDSDQGF